MSAYRFCRSDDVPLLVQAYNECYQVHLPQLAPLTVERFKRWIREWNLWTSSCMVAFAGDRPIGVLLAAKRETESLLLNVGVHPGYTRQGHGRHLMTSLSAKMAILGPPRMIAEVPAYDARGIAFLEACGYRREATFTRFRADPLPGDFPGAELLAPVGAAELVDHGFLAFPERARCWERSRASLLNLRERARGLAVAGEDRIEACVLYHDPDGGDERRLLALEAVDGPRAPTLLRLLCDAVRAGSGRPVVFPAVGGDEPVFGLLASWGFQAEAETIRFADEARPG